MILVNLKTTAPLIINKNYSASIGRILKAEMAYFGGVSTRGFIVHQPLDPAERLCAPSAYSLAFQA